MYKLTVLIPSYNLKTFAKKCVDSIIQQVTNFEFNIVINDDCSSDGTYEYLSSIYSHNKSVTVLKNETNLGYELNTKKIMNMSNSKYIMYLDIDDYLSDSNYIQRAIDFLDKNEEYTCYAGSYKWILPDYKIKPSDGRYFVAFKDTFVNSDLHSYNPALFARVIRNNRMFLQFVHTKSELLHVDWITNYEITEHGYKIHSEIDRWCGYYRITGTGKLSGRSPEYAHKMHIHTINHLNTYYINKNV